MAIEESTRASTEAAMLDLSTRIRIIRAGAALIDDKSTGERKSEAGRFSLTQSRWFLTISIDERPFIREANDREYHDEA